VVDISFFIVETVTTTFTSHVSFPLDCVKQAAWYPDKPSKEDQSQMSAFMISLARFYPCTWCATDFQENVAQTPPATASRTELCQWICDQHNRVNEKKGKPIFACDMKTLDDRWRKSERPECKDSYLYHGPH